MGKYERAIEKTGLDLSESCSLDQTASALLFSFDADPLVRRVAAKALCPCHVRANVPDVWDRLLEMTADPDPGVRSDVIHALADGSPRERAPQIAEALEALYNDPDVKVRKRVRFVLSAYRRTGRLNVL
jgi:HEAT repeat protein